MRHCCQVLLMIMGALFLGACASRLNLQQGIQSFQVQDFRQAFIRLKPEAEKGNKDAQYAIGYMYYYGQGVIEDKKQAWIWINLAAKRGQPDAIQALKILSRRPSCPKKF